MKDRVIGTNYQESKQKVYDHIYPDIKTWPIYKLSESRSQVVSEVTDFAFNILAEHFDNDVERLIARTIYLEKIRIKENPWKADPPNELSYWRRVEQEFGNILPNDPLKAELELSLLKRLIH